MLDWTIVFKFALSLSKRGFTGDFLGDTVGDADEMSQSDTEKVFSATFSDEDYYSYTIRADFDALNSSCKLPDVFLTKS
jgi:hypothetical protein